MRREDTTRNFYETRAKEYFQATYATNMQSLWDKLIQKLPVSASLLDLGCGSGRDLRHFSCEGFNVVGIDYSYSMLKLAKEFSKGPVICGDFFHLPFKDRSFDAVWAIASFVHTPRYLISLGLSEIHRVLKHGALLITSLKKGTGEIVDSLGRYNIFYGKGEIEAILKDNLYDIVDIEESTELREKSLEDRKKVEWIAYTARAT